MADSPQTPEAVALELLKLVTKAVDKDVDQDWILATYRACLRAAKGLNAETR